MDETKSLFEHLKNRLPTGFGLGDDGTEIVDGVPNHKVMQQSIREDHEGDVGIFDVKTSQQRLAMGLLCWNSVIQIAVVTNNGDINGAIEYLLKGLENFKKDRKSTGITVSDVSLTSIMGIGKNSNGFQMAAMTFVIEYSIK
jgi:hypothetical protein